MSEIQTFLAYILTQIQFVTRQPIEAESKNQIVSILRSFFDYVTRWSHIMNPQIITTLTNYTDALLEKYKE